MNYPQNMSSLFPLPLKVGVMSPTPMRAPPMLQYVAFLSPDEFLVSIVHNSELFKSINNY